MKNKKVLEAEWATYKPRLENYIFSIVKDSDDTKDIVQEVFIKAFTRFETLKNDSKLPQWLFSIARNEIHAFFNAKKKTQMQLPLIDSDENLPTTTPIEICATTFIGTLPKKYSEAIQLTVIENIPQIEYAKKVNISYSGAKSRVQRAKEKLKKLITNCCAITHDSYGNIIDYTPQKNSCCIANC